MISVIGIDPGTTESAYMALDRDKPVSFGKLDNKQLLSRLDFLRIEAGDVVLAVEMVQGYGMAVGSEVFETCVWIGRFIERWRGRYNLIMRGAIRWHLCDDRRAKDANVRAALIERYGGKSKAIGLKKNPGPLHGVVDDIWSALAVATVHREKALAEPGTGIILP